MIDSVGGSYSIKFTRILQSWGSNIPATLHFCENDGHFLWRHRLELFLHENERLIVSQLQKWWNEI